jgi:acetylornithine deacetylase
VAPLWEVAELAAELVAIDSVNPELVPGSGGEAEIAQFVAEWLRRAGLEVEVEEAAPGRPNVVAVARGSGGGRSLMLNAHTDTVGVATMEDGLRPRIEDGRLYGRGSFDMKGSLAAIMLAGREAARSRRRRSRRPRREGAAPAWPGLPRSHSELRGDVIVSAVVDEELGSVGTEALVRKWRADAAIVTEPTSMHVSVAHKGFVAFEVETWGRAAHGSRPDLGVDAIAKMGHVLVWIQAVDRSLRSRPGHRLLGSGSVHASLIAGGQEYSSYPERCTLQGERRTVPGETVAQVEQELRSIIAQLSTDDPQFEGSFRTVFSRQPYEIDEGEPIVELVRRHAGDAEIAGETFWTDAALIAAAGIPTVLFGPGGEGAHAAVEWVDLEQLQRCVEIYTAVALEFCA